MPDDAAPSLPATRRVVARRHDGGGSDASGAADRSDCVAEEAPVSLVYNGRSFAVMMASPADLVDFALGFSLTEGVIETAAEFLAAEVRDLGRGIELAVTVAESRALALRARSRALAGRTGCGLCGVEQIGEALRPIPRLTDAARISAAAIERAVAVLPDHQPINRATGATHVAAFADRDGTVRFAREDVGRHNALDKTIGAMAAAGIDPAGGFVLVSSRCSYEMVHKTAAAGVPLIVAVSAPTSLAVDLAEKVGVCLVAYAREGRFTVYAGCDGVVD